MRTRHPAVAVALCLGIAGCSGGTDQAATPTTRMSTAASQGASTPSPVASSSAPEAPATSAAAPATAEPPVTPEAPATTADRPTAAPTRTHTSASPATTTPTSRATSAPTTDDAPTRHPLPSVTKTPRPQRTPHGLGGCRDLRGHGFDVRSGDLTCSQMVAVADGYWAKVAAGTTQGHGLHADIGPWHCATAVLENVPMSSAPTQCDKGSDRFFITG